MIRTDDNLRSIVTASRHFEIVLTEIGRVYGLSADDVYVALANACAERMSCDRVLEFVKDVSLFKATKRRPLTEHIA